jgi:hypothetical protein
MHSRNWIFKAVKIGSESAIKMGNDQEVEFHEIEIDIFHEVKNYDHEIEIAIFHEIKIMIMRSNLFMTSKVRSG